MSDPAFAYTSQFLYSLAKQHGVPDDVLALRVRRAFRTLARRVDPTVVLEIGAFEAGFCRWARGQFPDARVVAYEANPYVYDRFKDEVTAAGVEYVNAAVGPQNGTIRLNVPKDWNGTARDRVNQIASLGTHLRSENYEVVEVDGIRLDDTLALTPDDRLVVWLDVEGALDAVLPGCRETLARASTVYVEVENSPMSHGQWLDVDVARWFREIGMVPILRDRQRHFQYNLVLVSEELLNPRTVKLATSVYKPVEPPVPEQPERPASLPRLGRVQGILQRTLQANNARLRDQNQRLQEQNRRLRRANGRLRRHLAD